MSEQQVDRLNSIGMIWSKEELWELNYQRALRYYRLHGSLPHSMADCETAQDKDVYRWLYRQKTARTQGRLTISQEERLQSLGMT